MADAGRILIIPRGDYNANSTYEKLDLVKHKGTSWLAKKNATGVEPSEANAEYWQNMFGIGIVDNLTTTEAGYALDARQGKILMDKLEIPTIYGTDVNTIKNAYDTFSESVEELVLYKFNIQHAVGYEPLGGGRWYVEGFKTADAYEYQEAKCYGDSGVRIFTRSKYNNVWNPWSSLYLTFGTVFEDGETILRFANNCTTNSCKMILSPTYPSDLPHTHPDIEGFVEVMVGFGGRKTVRLTTLDGSLIFQRQVHQTYWHDKWYLLRSTIIE